METKTKKISFLIPCYNEEENVVPLSEAIVGQLEGLSAPYDYEIVFIDNCSTDGTRARIEELCGANKKIKAIFNARNFGQFNSPFYGILQTTGDCVVTMCADFQDPPEMIPSLIAEWENGYKIVCAVKTQSEEGKFVRLLRTIYYKLIRKFSDIEQIEHFTGTGLYDKSFIEVLRGLDDPAPFMRGIVAELGYKKIEVPYKQQKRRAGKTHNNFNTLYDAAMLSFTQYTKFPIRSIMFFGIFLNFISIAGGVICLIVHSFHRNVMLPAIFCGMGFFFSLTFIFMSMLGEYLLNIKTKVNHRPLVIEEKRINFDE